MIETETDLCKAAMELEELKRKEQSVPVTQHQRFPPNCLKLLYSIPGNQRCIDCNATNPQWASLTFGTLLCIGCSGHHRHMGVQVCLSRFTILSLFPFIFRRPCD